MAKAVDKVTEDMGAPIKTFEGLEGLRIHSKLNKPKTNRGRQRIWIIIKQDADAKRWRVAESLSYVNAVHIQFEALDPEVHEDLK
jgi:hypothetical protein